jgi:hypothetical protein
MKQNGRAGILALAGLFLWAGSSAALPERETVDLPAPEAGGPPVLDIRDTAVFEGSSGWHLMSFVVRLSAPALTTVSFHYATFAATASGTDADFIPAAAHVELAPGDTTVTVGVYVVGDGLLEGNERFLVRISEVVNATPGDTLAIGTILNDERTGFARILTGIPNFGPGTLAPSWGDADGDGLPDLPMYQNTGNNFLEMPGFRLLLGDSNYHGGAWCDYDRDGDQDLVLMPYGDSTSSYNRVRLLENTPSGFLDVAPALGMNVTGYGETPVWADFDADGWPDLFLPFYSHTYPYRSFLYLSNHDGTFTEFADSAGLTLSGLPFELRPEGSGAADWNGDGTIDLFCAHHLFLNDGDARFHDVAVQVGLPVIFDEGGQFVDHDNDGDFDLYLRTIAGPTLYRNDGGILVEASATLGIGFVGWQWGDRWSDVDLDGDLDLIYFDTGGFPHLVLADGSGGFHADAGLDSLFSGSSLCAFADFDGDGDPDVVMGAHVKDFARNQLDQVPHARTPYLKVRVEDHEGRLVEHGSTVRLRALEDPLHPVQTRIVDGGSGYLAQDEYTITFGGVGSGSFDLEVSFPGKLGAPVVVGPAQSSLLAGLRPGDSPPRTYVVRPDGEVFIEQAGPSALPSLARRSAPAAAEGVATLALAASAEGVAMLAPAQPNPARQDARFSLSLPAPALATIEVFDLGGRLVRTLVDGPRAAGQASVAWDLRDQGGRPVDAGLYFVRLVHDGRPVGTRRVIVLR